MVATRDITDYYKDEQIVYDIVLQDAAGAPLDTTNLVVSMVASATSRGANEWDAPKSFALLDGPTATYRRVLSPDDLSIFVEGAAKYYAIWSKRASDPPIVRATGRIQLKESISLSGAE